VAYELFLVFPIIASSAIFLANSNRKYPQKDPKKMWMPKPGQNPKLGDYPFPRTGFPLNNFLSNKSDNVYNININTHRRKAMRTNVVIDDELMESALKISGLKTKKDAIEEGLKLLVQVKGQKKIKSFRGKLKWTGNLDEMRLDK